MAAVIVVEEPVFSARFVTADYSGDFDCGPRLPRCQTGGSRESTLIGLLAVHERIMSKIAEWVRKIAPTGAEATSWKY